nr:immunoglobulin heavy chain junction region [Macaca mulatta]
CVRDVRVTGFDFW